MQNRILMKYEQISDNKIKLQSDEIYQLSVSYSTINRCLKAGILCFLSPVNNRERLISITNSNLDYLSDKKYKFFIPYWIYYLTGLDSFLFENIKHLSEGAKYGRFNTRLITDLHCRCNECLGDDFLVKIYRYLNENKEFREFWLNKRLLEDV